MDENEKIDFKFKWEGIKFDQISTSVIEMAEKLLEHNLIKVQPELNENGSVVITHTGVCSKSGMIEALSYGLAKENVYSKTFNIKPSHALNVGCTGRKDSKGPVTCELNSCPIIAAGYLYYLRNKKEEETDINSIDISQVDLYARNLSELESYQLEPELKQLLMPLAMPETRGFRCAIVGEEGTDKQKIINEIKRYLFNIGKISNNTAYKVRIDDFGSTKDRRTLADGYLYWITDIDEYVQALENNADSSTAEAGRSANKVGISNFVNNIKNKYIVVEASSLEFKKFLKTNPKLSYLFEQVIYVEDYTDEKIVELFESNLPDNLKEKFDDVKKQDLLEYLGKNRKYLPFKNADLSIFLASYCVSKGMFALPAEREKDTTLEEMFSNIIGMDNVKKQMTELYEFLLLRDKMAKLGKKLPDFNLHMMFLGNPGTGKTMIARLVAKTLFDLGYTKENKLIEVESKDLIASFTGQTAGKTGRVIESALGGVLFIDEAYSLYSGKQGNSFGLEAISTLIKAMEDYKGELVVIFAGYTKEMQSFLQANSGIKSRIGYTFEFADYTEDELYEIFKLKTSKFDMSITESAEKSIRELINFGKSKSNFGNGRYIDNILQKILTKHSMCIGETGDFNILDKESIPSVDEISTLGSGIRNPEIVKELFDDVVGLENVKKQVVELGNYIKFKNKMSELSNTTLPEMRLHMLFTGDAGTGKTTMARKITKMLYNLGCIRIDKLIEVDRKDLVAEYIGQTAPKTTEVIESALGGVLFIDEAYSLTPIDNARDFGQEAIATLIKAMEDNRDDLVVIFAGYTEEMKRFVESNSGIASRIGYVFEFENYNDEELYKIFEIKSKKYNLVIEKNVKSNIMEVFKYFSSVEGFGNGRFVDKLLQEILVNHANNVTSDDKLNVISVEDIPSIKEMIELTYNSRDNLVIPADVDIESRRKIAIHELGHAIAHYLHNNATNIKVITVIPEGIGSLGYVLNERPKNKIHYSKQDYLRIIEELLAGRAAEELFLGKENISSGCSKDLNNARNVLNNMFYYYGMSESLGLLSVVEDTSLERKISIEEQRKQLNDCYNNVLSLLSDNKGLFDKVLSYLMDKGTITGEEFIKVIEEKEEVVAEEPAPVEEKAVTKKPAAKKPAAKKTTKKD